MDNLGISGRNFSEQNAALVTEMTRKFLDYTKSARLEAADPEIVDRRHADPDRIEVRMTSEGYPIIPKLVMEKELKKSEWELLLRTFLTQHYCEQTYQFRCIRIRTDILQIWPVVKSLERYLTAQ
jgi:hypothetical protein